MRNEALGEALVQWACSSTSPSFICLPSVRQNIQNCQILEVFTSPTAAWEAWLSLVVCFFHFKMFSEAISPLFSFLLESWKIGSLALSHTS